VRFKIYLSLGVVSVLSACGGGGVDSAGSTAPAPIPTNTSLRDLRVSQSFTNDATSTAVSFDLVTQTTITGKAAPVTLTVRYDAATQSYTLTTPGQTQTFAPSDISSTDPSQVQYKKTDGSNRDVLTLVKAPYSGPVVPSYVGMAYWQRNTSTGNQQNSLFDIFTYGLETPAAAVPRSGTANFGIDVFGLSATPGVEPRTFQGHGLFTTDFAAGIYSTNTYLTETGLISGSTIVGGGLQLQGAGSLSAGTGTFSGGMLYGGQSGTVAGSMAGRFYGPAAQEIGASFSGSNADGASVVGSFTGQLDPTAVATNLTLTNLVTGQLFYTREARLTLTTFDANASTPQVWAATLIGGLNRENSDTFSYGPGESDLPGGTFTATSLTTSTDPNFVAYSKTFNGQDVRLELYKPGAANTELALTYVSFGRWSSSSKNGVVNEADKVLLAFGLETPAQLLSAKTGTGHYAGVAYGAGANQTTGATYDVKGSSSFDVDFSAQRYSGALGLKGAPTNGAAAVDFGSYSFSGPLSAYAAESTATLTQGNVAAGSMTQRFYGPNGEEIGGPFTLIVQPGFAGAGTTIAGVAVAKRQ
jgi:hypothetical protein